MQTLVGIFWTFVCHQYFPYFVTESCQLASVDTVHHMDAVSSAAGASDAEEHHFLPDTQNWVGFIAVCALDCILSCV